MKRIKMLNHCMHWQLGDLTRRQIRDVPDAIADELIGLGVAESIQAPEAPMAPKPEAVGVVQLSSVLPAAPVYETKIVDELPRRRRGRRGRSE